jgi:PrpF protein
MTAAGGTRCMMMRGGTSRGLYFLASDLPEEPAERDSVLLRVMGSGHPLQIDGLGGMHPLTSKVAVVSRSARDDADVDYLFLQLDVEQATITDQQNCGNILAGVGPPSGNRIELCNPCARLIFGPDWEPISWSEAERARAGIGTRDHPVVPYPRHPAGPLNHGSRQQPGPSRQLPNRKDTQKCRRTPGRP